MNKEDKPTALHRSGKYQQTKAYNVGFIVEMFVERYKKTISEKCTGCCMGSQNPRDGIICKLKKKDQILNVFDEIDMQITDNGMLEYIERNGGVYTEAIDKHSLMSTVVAKRKLVNSIEKCV